MLGIPFFAVTFVLWLKWWIAMSIPFIIYGIVLLLRLGKMAIIQKGDLQVVHFKDRTGERTLITPINYTSYWTYEHPKTKPSRIGAALKNFIPGSNKEEQGSSNAIMVVLHLKDAEDKELLVLERIVLDTRFPNEQPYSMTEPNLELDNLMVQRVDKATGFLITNLGDDLFKRIDKF